MKLVIGLGNPGREYKKSRHNIGHMIIDELNISKAKRINGFKAVKTDTFMNKSGNFAKKLVDQYKINMSDLWIIHDDLDIKLGDYKIQFAKGPKDHNGILSIEEKLGTQDFWRVRIGVDNREPDNRVAGEQYVLEDFTEAEIEPLSQVIKKVVKDLYGRLS